MEASTHPVLMKQGKVLALIPARGGSKGLPRKNVLEAGGRPLLAWTVDAGLGARCVDRVVLSSDDDEIMAAASSAGCDVPFRRPAELATDQASSMDVVFHALQELSGYDYVVLLQPTSPLRTAKHIDEAFDLMLGRGAPACVSVTEVEQSPYWMYRLSSNDHLISLLSPPPGVSRRQDLPSAYTLNGAIYIANVEWLSQSRSFLSPETIGYTMDRSESLDIDDRDDFEAFLRKITPC